MSKSQSVLRAKARDLKKRLKTKKLLQNVSAHLKGRKLFPHKIEKAQAFFKSLRLSNC